MESSGVAGGMGLVEMGGRWAGEVGNGCGNGRAGGAGGAGGLSDVGGTIGAGQTPARDSVMR